MQILEKCISASAIFDFCSFMVSWILNWFTPHEMLYYCIPQYYTAKIHALQMTGRWKSNINVWFLFMYSQKWNCYFQNRIIMFRLRVPTLIYLWEIYRFSGSVCLFCRRDILYVDLPWEYINCSQTHECGNWDWGHAIPRKGIHNRDFPCSVYGGHWTLDSKWDCMLYGN